MAVRIHSFGRCCVETTVFSSVLILSFETNITAPHPIPPNPFNIFLKRITTDVLEDHEGSVCIEGRTITNLRFADDIDSLVGEEEERAKLPTVRRSEPRRQTTPMASTQRSK